METGLIAMHTKYKYTDTQMQIHRYAKRFPGKYELFAFIGYFEMDNDEYQNYGLIMD